MGVVVLGDVGSRVAYHVGDEAMTEYALVALEQRGVSDVTMMASGPAIAAERFGRPAVPLIGFDADKTDAGVGRRYAEVVGALTDRRSGLSRQDPARDVIRAVQSASGVIICGGGNIASQFPVHLFERLALAAIARHFEIPLVITSQTFGPTFKPEHEKAVGEMLAQADLVGAREAESYDLALKLGARPERTAHGLDDGYLLEPTEADVQAVAALNLPSEFVLASFTGHPGSTGWTREENQRRVAETLDLLAAELQMPVLLASHVGSLLEHRRHHDQLANDAIAQVSTSGRVTVLPMLTARQIIEVTRRSRLNLSTRYHPTVFGPAVGTPSLAITQSVYSSVKIGGSLRNVGLGDYAIPTASWRPELIVEAAKRQLDPATGLTEHLNAVREVRTAELGTWWDAVAACVEGRGVAEAPASLSSVPVLAGSPSWRDEIATVTRVSDDAERSAIAAKWEIERLRGRVRKLKAKLDA